jgi:hypothetical protein
MLRFLNEQLQLARQLTYVEGTLQSRLKEKLAECERRHLCGAFSPKSASPP